MTNDEQTIHQIIQYLQDAWNAGDSKAFAAPFSEDADFINVLGMHFKGRSEVERGHRYILDTAYRDSTTSYTIEDICFLRPDVAIVFVRAHLRLSRNGKMLEGDARPTMIFAQSEGKWEVASYQNTAIADAHDPTA